MVMRRQRFAYAGLRIKEVFHCKATECSMLRVLSVGRESRNEREEREENNL